VRGGDVTVVEVNTAGDFRNEPATAPPIQRQLSADGTLQLGPWAVAVVTRFVFQTYTTEKSLHNSWPTH
jgi:hypothetical protein